METGQTIVTAELNPGSVSDVPNVASEVADVASSNALQVGPAVPDLITHLKTEREHLDMHSSWISHQIHRSAWQLPEMDCVGRCARSSNQMTPQKAKIRAISKRCAGHYRQVPDESIDGQKKSEMKAKPWIHMLFSIH